MLSLAKAKTEEEILSFFNKAISAGAKTFFVEPKLDGLALSVELDNNKKDFYMPVLYDLNNLKMIPFNLIAEELKESPKEALELGLQEALRIIYNDICEQNVK